MSSSSGLCAPSGHLCSWRAHWHSDYVSANERGITLARVSRQDGSGDSSRPLPSRQAWPELCSVHRCWLLTRLGQLERLPTDLIVVFVEFFGTRATSRPEM